MFIKAIDGAFAQLDQSDKSGEAQAAPDLQSGLDSSLHSNQENVSAETSFPDQAPGSQQNVSAETPADCPEQQTDTFPQKRADALMLLAEQSFMHNADDLTPLSTPQRHQLVIHP